MQQEPPVLEAQFRDSQEADAIVRRAGTVAHDLNNRLTIISGYSDLLLNEASPTDPDRDALEQIRVGEPALELVRANGGVV
jgi:two-component system, cell cycle sensor histidine kinase and response regulator CckA